MSDYVELYIDQGTDFGTTININNDNDNLPLNTAGYTVTSQLRKSLLSSNAVDRFTCTISDPANGGIDIAMSASNTANLRPGSYFYDVKITDTADVTTRLIEGIIFVTPAITK